MDAIQQMIPPPFYATREETAKVREIGLPIYELMISHRCTDRVVVDSLLVDGVRQMRLRFQSAPEGILIPAREFVSMPVETILARFEELFA